MVAEARFRGAKRGELFGVFSGAAERVRGCARKRPQLTHWGIFKFPDNTEPRVTTPLLSARRDQLA